MGTSISWGTTWDGLASHPGDKYSQSFQVNEIGDKHQTGKPNWLGSHLLFFYNINGLITYPGRNQTGR